MLIIYITTALFNFKIFTIFVQFWTYISLVKYISLAEYVEKCVPQICLF